MNGISTRNSSRIGDLIVGEVRSRPISGKGSDEVQVFTAFDASMPGSAKKLL